MKQVLGELKNSRQLVKRAAQAAMIEAMMHIQKLADQTVPEDTGELRKSWRVPVPEIKGDTVEGSVEYTADHALFVHEWTDPSVNWTRPGSGPKWLEQAMDQGSKEALGVFADEFWSMMRSGKAGSVSEKKGATAK